MTTVIDVTDAYVAQSVALDPVLATVLGVGGHDDELTDYSPSAQEERNRLRDRTLTQIDRLTPTSAQERLVADLARERLTAGRAVDDAEHLRRLSIIGSPLQAVRTVFELMPRADDDDWEVLVRRLRALPASVESMREALDRGLSEGVVAARRQAEACATQALVYGGGGDGAGSSFGQNLVAAFERRSDPDTTLRRDLAAAARAADAAFVTFARYLRDTYAPRATTTDAVGEERYRRFARHFTGAHLDLEELYRWGWQEVWSLSEQMRQTAAQVSTGASVREAVDVLERDVDGAVHGAEAFRLWAQQLQDEAIATLHGTHFDIPADIREIEVRLAPPGSAAAPYYTQPSEDLSRPGRVWYPTRGGETFPLWSAVSTAYHEGVPGHHLQIATAVYRRDSLSRFQRTTMVSGHAEGWALYAERLMDELGFLHEPAYRLGYLAAQMMRALRVVIDVGLHTGRPIDPRDPVHGGRAWTPQIAEQMLQRRALRPSSFTASEIVRYLGWPGQAIGYKVGERIWLDARETVRHRLGARFNLAAFHDRALRLGPLGLDLLAERLAEPEPHPPGAQVPGEPQAPSMPAG